MRRALIVLSIPLLVLAGGCAADETGDVSPEEAPTPTLETFSYEPRGTSRPWHGTIDGIECISAREAITCNWQPR